MGCVQRPAIGRRQLCHQFALAAGFALFSPGISAAGGGAAFPVTIRHVFGTTVIPAEPQRIVTIGWTSEDAVLALGKVPVGMPRYSFFESGIFPWNEERLNGQRPFLMTGRAVDFEAVAALQPDLILATNSDINEIAWKRLSSIAPTVAYRQGAFQTGWREQAELVGAALGKSEEASGLIANVEKLLDDMGRQNPVLAGKTFVFGTYFPGAGNIVVYLPPDPRVEVLSRFGLRPPADVERLAQDNPGVTSVAVSLEKADLLDADILLMWYGKGARADAEKNPLFRMMRPVRQGSYVALEDPTEVWSTSALSILSIPYGFPRFIPRLTAAAAAAEQPR